MSVPDSEIRSRLIDCFATVFPLPAEEIVLLDSRIYDEWDSLAAISLVTVIEEDFDVVLDDADIGTMTTFEAALEALTKVVA